MHLIRSLTIAVALTLWAPLVAPAQTQELADTLLVVVRGREPPREYAVLSANGDITLHYVAVMCGPPEPILANSTFPQTHPRYRALKARLGDMEPGVEKPLPGNFMRAAYVSIDQAGIMTVESSEYACGDLAAMLFTHRPRDSMYDALQLFLGPMTPGEERFVAQDDYRAIRDKVYGIGSRRD